MKKGKLKILDFYVHGSAQYELSKLNHLFFFVDPNSKAPNWNINHRPLRSNVKLITEKEALLSRFDIVIIRSPLNPKRYEPFMRRGAIPVAAVQTTNPFPLSPKVKHVVWNCSQTMKKFSRPYYPGKNNYHIVHGFDPDEFEDLKLDRMPRVLTVANAFKKRKEIMGYDLWRGVNDSLGICDILGHDNENINSDIRQADTFAELIEYYNKYQVFLNTTIDSAMPRSRGEAAMCASAIVSTKNHSIGNYFEHKKDILYANSESEMIDAIKLLLNNKELSYELGQKARETAVKHFHIKDYIEKWSDVFRKL